MRPLLALLLLLLTTAISAQTWQWTRHIGGPGEDQARIGAVDESGNLYVRVSYAFTNANGPYNNCYIDGDTVLGRADSFLAKYAPDGTQLWLRNCNSHLNGTLSFSDMAIDTVEQALYVVGRYLYSCVLDTCSLSTPFSAGFLSKWTYDGSCLWARNIATCPQDLMGSTCGLSTVAFDPAGRVIMGGAGAPYWPTTVEGEQFPPSSFVVACDMDGTPLWSRVLAENVGTNTRLSPLTIRVRNEQVFIHNRLSIGNALDTIGVDTFQLTGFQGGGYALLSMTADDGTVEWVQFDALGAVSDSPEYMGMDATGTIFVVGVCPNMAVFGADTIQAGPGAAKWYLVSYDQSGDRTMLREFGATGNTTVSVLEVLEDGSLAICGLLWQGSGEWDGIPFMVTESRELFISTHAPDGTCINLTHGSACTATSMYTSSAGHYMTARFGPPLWPDPVTLGNDTYTSYGYQDAVLAKHDILTGIIAPKSAQVERLLIYANPNKGTFRVVVPDALVYDPHLHLRVFDATGRMVREQRMDMGERRPRVEVEGVGRGYYMVTLGNGHRTYSGSMVVE